MNIGFAWSTEKNRRLLMQRGVSFERVVVAIEHGGLMDMLEHPNQDDYPGQLIYAVEIDKYIHLLPFVKQTDGTRSLKTVSSKSVVCYTVTDSSGGHNRIGTFKT